MTPQTGFTADGNFTLMTNFVSEYFMLVVSSFLFLSHQTCLSHRNFETQNAAVLIISSAGLLCVFIHRVLSTDIQPQVLFIIKQSRVADLCRSSY